MSHYGGRRVIEVGTLDGRSFRQGMSAGVPFLVPFFVFGVAFGVLAVEAGLRPELAVLASALVASGSAQFAMLALLPLGAVPVLIATTGLAIRHIPMGATLRQALGRTPRWSRSLLAFVLVDETFGLTLNAQQREVTSLAAYKHGADLVLYGNWVISTAAGAFFVTGFDVSVLGLDEVFPITYIALAAVLVKERRDLWIVGIAVVFATAATFFIPPAWQVAVAAIGAAVAGSRLRD